MFKLMFFINMCLLKLYLLENYLKVSVSWRMTVVGDLRS